MSRYRLTPTPAQEAVMRSHCDHARLAWNVALEQQSWWRPGRKSAPNWVAQCRQLTEARAEFGWLRAGSSIVQKQAIRDFSQAMSDFFAGTHGYPTWRRAGLNEGFRITGAQGQNRARRLSRHVGEVHIPKAGWVRFRWSRAVPAGTKSYRVKLDRSGRWHISFAAWPAPTVPGPGTGQIVGIDRGITVSAALSTGELLNIPHLSPARKRRLVRLQRKLHRAGRNSRRRERVRLAAARLHARATSGRTDWAEKTSTDLTRRFDVIRVEDLRVRNMTRTAKGTAEKPGRNVRQKAGLNREILASGWGLLVRRLEEKAPGRVEKIPAAYTSQCCSACGTVHRESRESQADFRCTACGYACNADVNAAINIAAGHAVNARGADRVAGAMKREPQIRSARTGIPGLTREDAKQNEFIARLPAGG